MRIEQALSGFILCLFAIHAPSQLISAPEPQTASILGVVTDTDDRAIPGATVTVRAIDPASDSRPNAQPIGQTTGDGSFVLSSVRPAVSYHVVVSAAGFADWTSATIVLSPGQQLNLAEIRLAVGAVETSVSAIQPEELALEQVKDEESQRLFGVVPNFYVVYDQRFVPLSAKLKFKLALRAGTDVVSLAGAGVLAGVNQASGGSPNYVQGAKGFGQRFGAGYAGGFSDILIGGAVLPSLLHQDPRYFYQGTGTKKSRVLHALSAPFVAKGDDDRWQFNYSSVGGDLASGALNNLYYPERNRGVGLVFSSAAITTGGRIANALAQEFFFSRYTSKGKNHN
jgi:Carboxypeptidase regulatory-like domain